MTPELAFQDYYPEDLAQCYGCGSHNEHGHQLKSYWDGEETVARITPKPWHTAIPGFVYGGFLASIIDCHGTGTASAAAYKAEGRTPDTLPAFRFVTASLKVNYHKPTPLGPELEIRGKVLEIKGKKIIVSAEVLVEGEKTVSGEIVCVQMPDTFRLTQNETK
ncbi:MAG: PaaI family thioesterase [Bacteroidales bacterium]|nr:PaaI family thioesterase [Bacteroidales bacterium]